MTVYPTTADEYQAMCADDYSNAMKRRPYFRGHGDLQPALDAQGRVLFKRWGLLWKVPLFEFTNSPIAPLTFCDADGSDWQPDNHFVTDGGSIPPPLWDMPFLSLGPWNSPRAFPLHDSIFTYGGAYRGGKFYRISRDHADGILRRAVLADTGSKASAAAVRIGVWVGSRFVWDEKAHAEARFHAGITVAG